MIVLVSFYYESLIRLTWIVWYFPQFKRSEKHKAPHKYNKHIPRQGQQSHLCTLNRWETNHHRCKYHVTRLEPVLMTPTRPNCTVRNWVRVMYMGFRNRWTGIDTTLKMTSQLWRSGERVTKYVIMVAEVGDGIQNVLKVTKICLIDP